MRGKGLPRPSEQHGRSYGPCHVISARGTLCARRGLTGHLGFLCAVRHPAPALLYEIEVNCCCPRRMVTRSEPWIATCAGALCVPADFCFSKRPALSPNLGRPSLPECTPFFFLLACPARRRPVSCSTRQSGSRCCASNANEGKPEVLLSRRSVTDAVLP